MTHFEPSDLTEAESYPSLGPAYFAARRTAERFMSQFESEHFKPLIDAAAESFRTKLWDDLCAWLLSGTESNLQGEVWRFVDNAVDALLGGQPWALQRYALGDRYDAVKVRAAIAAYIPKEIMEARLADLEKENKDLQDTVERMRRY